MEVVIDISMVFVDGWVFNHRLSSRVMRSKGIHVLFEGEDWLLWFIFN